MMMIAKNKFSWVLLLVCLVVGWFRPVQGFQSVQPRTVVVSPTTTTTALNVFGNKKTAASRAAEAEAAAKYWQGEWVCKDCGYIYNRVRRWLVSKLLWSLCFENPSGLRIFGEGNVDGKKSIEHPVILQSRYISNH